MKNVEKDILSTTLKIFSNRLNVNKLKTGGIIGKDFDFKETFDIRKFFYNKKPLCNDEGYIPFIGASNSNNGFTGFTTYDTIIRRTHVNIK